MLALLTLTINANANKMNENNYDDIGGFFSAAATAESPNIKHFYISKAMLVLTMNRNGEMIEGFNLKKYSDKIDFIRRVEIKSNNTKKDRELLAGTEKLATQVYKTYNYTNLIATGGSGQRNYLFYKYGEGGLCSILVITTHKEFDEASEQASLKQASAVLIGGTFRAEDIPTIINF